MMNAKSKIRKSKSKLRVGVIFGGRSAEHEVSLVSATSIINALDKKKYEVIPIGITANGRWLSSPDILERFKTGRLPGGNSKMTLLPDPAVKGLVEIKGDSFDGNRKRLDVIFPVLHGTFGEDGTIQGLFELANIPYVGAGVLASSIGMDKIITKQLCEHHGITVSPYIWFLGKRYIRDRRKIILNIEKKLGYPCFIKPANSGSSVGISKAHNRKELVLAIGLASKYDRKILVEQGIEDAREIEVSVLGNDDPVASVPGEIISSNEFYDYDAKYVDGKSKSVIPAKLPNGVIRELQELAVRSFRAIDCSGMARVDFLVVKRNNKIVLNEINTIPGFTSISMYPKLWESSGIPFSRLLDQLIKLAIEKHMSKMTMRTSFRSKKTWYL